MKRYLAWFGLALMVLAVSAYGIARNGLKDLDAAARVDIGGSYLSTANGVLSYTRQGPLDAPVVILVHGFSTPKFVWEQVTPVLLDAGYQVISYDHLGRGFSDRPDGRYDSALYQSELSGLISGLKLSTPVTLVGYSMGGANVIDFAASNEKLIAQLILIAPAGYMPEAGLTELINAPILGDWLVTVFGKAYAMSSIREDVEAGLAPADMLDKFEQQTQYDGYTDSLLSTLRHFPMKDLGHRYRIVGSSSIPVTAIWGTDDEIVPFSGAVAMARDVPQLKLVPLAGGKHSITYTRSHEVAMALITALGESTSSS